jgi:hypothetical protein
MLKLLSGALTRTIGSRLDHQVGFSILLPLQRLAGGKFGGSGATMGKSLGGDRMILRWRERWMYMCSFSPPINSSLTVLHSLNLLL